MKRRGNLGPELISFANLHRGAMKARRGKRQRPDVLRFHFHLEHELWRLHDELSRHEYRPGPYHTFTIHEPKVRLISAASYRDRVVHHALRNVLEPVFLVLARSVPNCEVQVVGLASGHSLRFDSSERDRKPGVASLVAP
jgi:hypothetical protein